MSPTLAITLTMVGVAAIALLTGTAVTAITKKGLSTRRSRSTPVAAFVLTCQTLMAAGLLIGAFIPYHLWGTAFENQRAQNALLESFNTQATSSQGHLWLKAPAGQSRPFQMEPDRVWRDNLVEGAPVGKLTIQAIDLEVVFVEGTTNESLKSGPGRFRGLTFPGELGNTAIAGHRTTYGAPFGRIDELIEGDSINLETLDGVFTYTVTTTAIVTPDDGSELMGNDGETATLSLVSCHPKYSTAQRIVVHAELIGEPLPQPVEEPTRQNETLPQETGPTEDSATEFEADETRTEDSVAEVNANQTTSETLEPASNITWLKASADDLFDPMSDYTITTSGFAQTAGWAGLLGVLGAFTIASQQRRVRIGGTHLRFTGMLLGSAATVVCTWSMYGAIHQMLPAGI